MVVVVTPWSFGRPVRNPEKKRAMRRFSVYSLSPATGVRHILRTLSLHAASNNVGFWRLGRPYNMSRSPKNNIGFRDKGESLKNARIGTVCNHIFIIFFSRPDFRDQKNGKVKFVTKKSLFQQRSFFFRPKRILAHKKRSPCAKKTTSAPPFCWSRRDMALLTLTNRC